MSRILLAVLFLLLAVGSAAIGQPVPNKPSNGATGQPVDVVVGWRGLSAAAAYEVHFSTDSTFGEYDLIITEKTEAELLNLDYETTWFWRVRGLDDSKEPSTDWSATQSFTVKPSRGIPQPISPEDGATDQDQSVTLVWSSVDGSTGYEVEWAKASTFADAQSDNASGTSYTLSGLAYETQIFWRVRSAAAGAGPGEWSRFASFSTKFREPDPLPAPRLLSPGDNSVDLPTKASLAWGDVPGTDVRYVLQIAADKEFAELLPESGTADSTSQDVIALEPGTAYFWRVQAFNDETESPWSKTFRFTTGKDSSLFLFAPTLLTPINGAKQLPGNPLLTWDSVEGALFYEIQISGEPDFSDLDTIPSLSSDSTSLQLGDLTPGTIFHWRVRAGNGDAMSDWSKPFIFATSEPDLQLPGGISLISPADKSEKLHSPVKLAWTAGRNAAEYRIQLSKTGEFAGEEADLSDFDSTMILDELAEGVEYFWRVEGVNEAGEGPWSDTWSFTIDQEKLPLPTVPFLISPEDKASGLVGPVELVWSAAANAEQYVIQYSATGEFGGEETNVTATDTTTQVDGLKAGARYYWRAKAGNTSGESDWSGTRSFEMKGASTGVREKEIPVRDVTIYPVPATDRLTVSIDASLRGPIEIGLFNAGGERVTGGDAFELSGGRRNVTFDLSGIPSGVYYCRVASGEASATRSVVVVR